MKIKPLCFAALTCFSSLICSSSFSANLNSFQGFGTVQGMDIGDTDKLIFRLSIPSPCPGGNGLFYVSRTDPYYQDALKVIMSSYNRANKINRTNTTSNNTNKINQVNTTVNPYNTTANNTTRDNTDLNNMNLNNTVMNSMQAYQVNVWTNSCTAQVPNGMPPLAHVVRIASGSIW